MSKIEGYPAGGARFKQLPKGIRIIGYIMIGSVLFTLISSIVEIFL
ncbi:hypothetical protein [Halobacillus sp. A5]|nr:hypothetical protein [Halobacillus sp. A5]MCP3028453.1 hypothetical protein [Halobacillus sp. A5]